MASPRGLDKGLVCFFSWRLFDDGFCGGVSNLIYSEAGAYRTGVVDWP
jgi:hypothetical protein